MKKFLLALGAFSVIGQCAIAQEKVITGVVVSSEDRWIVYDRCCHHG